MEIKAKFEEQTGSLSLLNAILKEIKIHQENDYLNAVLHFVIAEGKTLKIDFFNISEYQFYYNDTHIFYNVEDYKFLITDDNKIYISLDPSFETTEANDNDMDFIKAVDFNVEWNND